MARNQSNKQDTSKEESPGPGIVDRVSGTVKRAVGAVGRAARGAAGRPEAGSDELFLVLHSDHEEVNQLFEKVIATDDKKRATDLWKRVSVSLLTHARAEQEVVYGRMSKEQELTEDVDHAIEEHEDIETLLFEANALVPGTEAFREKVTELAQTVRHHVDDEEGDLLPKATGVLDDKEREALVARFRDRKDMIEPDIAEELARPASKRSPTGSKRASTASALDGQTVKELRELARKRGIEGRSTMKKAELVAALEG